MVVAANKIYNLLFRGQRETISRAALEKLNDSLGARYRFSSIEQQRKIIDIFLELNMAYLKRPPIRFFCPEDQDDWFATFKKMLPHIISGYEPSLGHLHTYVVGWKMAALNTWQNEKGDIRLPANQRLRLNKLNRQIREGKIELNDDDRRFYDGAQFKTVSINALYDDESDLAEYLVGDDPREEAGNSIDGDLWTKIPAMLSEEEFKIFQWKEHPDYLLTNRDIADRIGVSHERVRQRLNTIRAKLKKRLTVYLGRLESESSR